MSQTTTAKTTQIKLLVNTASEAVSVIRERYGEAARVLSVKQVEAGGLKRLISKPRLEVIVEIPAQEPAKKEAARPETKVPKSEAPAPAAKPAAVEKPIEAAKEKLQETTTPKAQKGGGAVGNLYAKQTAAPEKPQSGSSYFSDFEDPAPQPEEPKEVSAEVKPRSVEPPLGSAANPVKRGTLEAVQRAIAMLESVGFDRSLIERVRGEIDFKDIGSLPTMDLYAKICDWLRSRFPNTKDKPLGNRRAFIGCSGVGKTAALSKMLSGDVFARGLTPTVLKIDSDLPNPSDGLEVFCEIMGATLARSVEEVGEVSDEAPLLVDMPGYSLANQASITACRDTLDELQVEERILVVNAAYEAELIAEMLSAGEAIGATRVVFTHLEETRKAGKLWKFLLNGRITPLFFCVGPNPAGEYTMETYSYLLERSFPNGRQLASAASRRRVSSGQAATQDQEVSIKS